MNRRQILTLAFGAISLLSPSTVFAQKQKLKKKFALAAQFQPQVVSYFGYPAGTIIIETGNHFLYLMLSNDEALRFGIGVGKAGLAFRGSANIGRKAKWPRWQPTENMIARSPEKYARFAGGVAGGPNNPLGARALYLYRKGRDTFFRIHGTTEPWSIGKSVSNGCIRMLNEHVTELYELVPVGAPVVVKSGA